MLLTLNVEFLREFTRPTGWAHVVLNYLGPNNGEGIRVYINGVLAGQDDQTSGTSKQPGDGGVVLGRTNQNSNDGSVDVDELLFFNETLSVDSIQQLVNMV